MDIAAQISIARGSRRSSNANAVRDQEARLRAGLRWLVWGSVIALTALGTWFTLSAADGSTAGMVAASSGSVAEAVAWSTGHLAIKTRLEQFAESAEPAR